MIRGDAYHLADGWAWAECAHRDQVEHMVWWPPEGAGTPWTLYECRACGAVTAGFDWSDSLWRLLAATLMGVA